MMGYTHNDRMRSKKLLEEKVLRKKVCNGEDPFGMWAVSECDTCLSSWSTLPIQSPVASACPPFMSF
jgi:hypothetical protein